MPLHRGELTVAEFSDNFNRLARFHGYSFIYGGYEAELDENGLWTKRDGGENIFFPDILGGGRASILAIRTDGAGVAEVSFRCESSNLLPSSCQREMTLTALSFACAQKGFGLFSHARKELLDAINGHPFESFEYSRSGIAVRCEVVRCEVEYSGYQPIGGSSPFPTFEAEKDLSFSLAFSIRRTD